MNDAGVLVCCDIEDDAGRHMKQVFMDKNLIDCECPADDRKTEVRAVVSNAQWKHVMSVHQDCIVLGAKLKMVKFT